MDGVARRALDAIVHRYARMLERHALSDLADPLLHPSDLDGQWASLEAAFIRRYVEVRTIEPVSNWYGTDVAVVL
jgi:hypothetical protein